MSRFKNVDGKRVKFTTKEEIDRTQEEEELHKNKSMKIWVSAMELSDSELIPRELEEHIQYDHNEMTNSLVLQKAYILKKQLREGKPKK